MRLWNEDEESEDDSYCEYKKQYREYLATFDDDISVLYMEIFITLYILFLLLKNTVLIIWIFFLFAIWNRRLGWSYKESLESRQKEIEEVEALEKQVREQEEIEEKFERIREENERLKEINPKKEKKKAAKKIKKLQRKNEELQQNTKMFTKEMAEAQSHIEKIEREMSSLQSELIEATKTNHDQTKQIKDVVNKKEEYFGIILKLREELKASSEQYQQFSDWMKENNNKIRFYEDNKNKIQLYEDNKIAMESMCSQIHTLSNRLIEKELVARCCGVCGKLQENMLRCECLHLYFCSRHCQKRSWKSHRHFCSHVTDYSFNITQTYIT